MPSFKKILPDNNDHEDNSNRHKKKTGRDEIGKAVPSSTDQKDGHRPSFLLQSLSVALTIILFLAGSSLALSRARAAFKSKAQDPAGHSSKQNLSADGTFPSPYSTSPDSTSPDGISPDSTSSDSTSPESLRSWLGIDTVLEILSPEPTEATQSSESPTLSRAEDSSAVSEPSASPAGEAPVSTFSFVSSAVEEENTAGSNSLSAGPVSTADSPAMAAFPEAAAASTRTDASAAAAGTRMEMAAADQNTGKTVAGKNNGAAADSTVKAASEKTTSVKAASEKAASEKAAPEKAASEKAAPEKDSAKDGKKPEAEKTAEKAAGSNEKKVEAAGKTSGDSSEKSDKKTDEKSDGKSDNKEDKTDAEKNSGKNDKEKGKENKEDKGNKENKGDKDSGNKEQNANNKNSKNDKGDSDSKASLTKKQKEYVQDWEELHGYDFPMQTTLHDYNWDYLEYDEMWNLYYKGDKKYKIRRGIDVSEFQGEIDWDEVKKAGYDFVFVRAGHRMFESGDLLTDSRAVKNMRQAKKAGLDVGVYVFSQAVSEEEAREEAQLCLDIIEKSGVEITLPVVFDPEIQTEYIARINYISGEQFTDNAVAFCKKIEKAGFTPAIYTNCSTETDILDMSRLDDMVIWYADYGIIPESPYRFTFWQYSNTGWVEGIPEGMTDLNVWFVEREEK